MVPVNGIEIEDREGVVEEVVVDINVKVVKAAFAKRSLQKQCKLLQVKFDIQVT